MRWRIFCSAVLYCGPAREQRSTAQHSNREKNQKQKESRAEQSRLEIESLTKSNLIKTHQRRKEKSAQQTKEIHNPIQPNPPSVAEPGKSSKPTRTTPIPRRWLLRLLLLLPELAGVNRLSPGLLAQKLQSDLGGVLFGVVDVLAVIPVAGRDVLALDGDGAGPGGSSSCSSDARVLVSRCQARKLKVGVGGLGWVGDGFGVHCDVGRCKGLWEWVHGYCVLGDMGDE